MTIDKMIGQDLYTLLLLGLVVVGMVMLFKFGFKFVIWTIAILFLLAIVGAATGGVENGNIIIRY